jgi:hypothetical protein
MASLSRLRINIFHFLILVTLLCKENTIFGR